MSAIPKSIHPPQDRSGNDPVAVNAAFLKYVPAVEKHANIQFRHLPDVDREEQIAESVAAAYVNYRSVARRGRANVITPGTLAQYAVLHVKDGRHVGGSADSKSDVMSRKAQVRRGFTCHSLHDRVAARYDCMRDPTAPVWTLLLAEDRREPVADLACFRCDWSEFLGQQHDRTRTACSMLAEGHKRCEVADRLGTTRPAVTQRMARAEREWHTFQGVEAEEVPEKTARPVALVRSPSKTESDMVTASTTPPRPWPTPSEPTS